MCKLFYKYHAINLKYIFRLTAVSRTLWPKTTWPTLPSISAKFSRVLRGTPRKHKRRWRGCPKNHRCRNSMLVTWSGGWTLGAGKGKEASWTPISWGHTLCCQLRTKVLTWWMWMVWKFEGKPQASRHHSGSIHPSVHRYSTSIPSHRPSKM